MDNGSVTTVAALLSSLGTFLLVVGLVITVFALARRTRDHDRRLARIERLLDGERSTNDRSDVPL